MLFLLLIAGLVMLYAGAELLVKGAVDLAQRFGIGPLVIGLTVVAFGTSAPELTVSIQAALAGTGDIAAANVVGSNIFNLAVILGLSALIFPIRITAQVVRVDMPVMIVVSVAGAIVLSDKALSRVEGLFLCLGIIGYMALSFYLARQKTSESFARQIEDRLEKSPSSPTRPVWRSAVMVIFGLILLVLGSKALVEGAVRLARLWGLSEAIIGLTIVSVGTSMPELATSVVAAMRRQADIAVGNIVGSNIFNILLILGASSVIRPYTAVGLTGVDIGVMCVLAALTLPFMWSRFTLSRFEGLILLVGYALYLAYRWPT